MVLEAFRDGGAFPRIANEPGRRRLEIPCPGSEERKMETLSDEPRCWLMVEKEIVSGRRLVRFFHQVEMGEGPETG